jgi:ABC-type sugar transport system ATPase subunit
MDEPLSNLDAKLRTHTRTELKALQQELGVTTIFVTHDQAEAMTMADRIVVMNHGRIQQVGPPLDVYRDPANRFVAGFVGSTQMNFLPASEIPIELPPAARNGCAVTVGIRPENLSIVGPDSSEAVLKAKVNLVEPLGGKDVVHVTVDHHDVRVIATPGLRPRLGETVGIALDRQRLHVFDDDTGKAIR